MTKSKERVFLSWKGKEASDCALESSHLGLQGGRLGRWVKAGMKEGGLWGAVTFCSLSKCLTQQELRQAGFLSQTPRTGGTPVGYGTWTPSFPSVVPLR